VREAAILRSLEGWRFAIEEFKDPVLGGLEYGIVPRAGPKPTNFGKDGSLGLRGRLHRTFTKTMPSTFQTLKRVPTWPLRLVPRRWSFGMGRKKQRTLDCSALLSMAEKAKAPLELPSFVLVTKLLNFRFEVGGSIHGTGIYPEAWLVCQGHKKI
jgi:hypothetical protein